MLESVAGNMLHGRLLLLFDSPEAMFYSFIPEGIKHFLRPNSFQKMRNEINVVFRRCLDRGSISERLSGLTGGIFCWHYQSVFDAKKMSYNNSPGFQTSALSRSTHDCFKCPGEGNSYLLFFLIFWGTSFNMRSKTNLNNEKNPCHPPLANVVFGLSTPLGAEIYPISYLRFHHTAANREFHCRHHGCYYSNNCVTLPKLKNSS